MSERSAYRVPDPKARQEQSAIAVKEDDGRRMHESDTGKGVVIPGRWFPANEDDCGPSVRAGNCRNVGCSHRIDEAKGDGQKAKHPS